MQRPWGLSLEGESAERNMEVEVEGGETPLSWPGNRADHGISFVFCWEE